MFKVGIIGPESTGKSTLARYLAQRYHATYIPEYAREYVESLAPTYAYTYEDVVRIARHQVHQLEELCALDHAPSLSASKSVCFFDTELIITKVWFLHKYGTCPDFLIEALRRFPMDVYLLCYPDIPWVSDQVRENPEIRLYLYEWYEREIQALNIPYYIIRHTQTSTCEQE